MPSEGPAISGAGQSLSPAGLSAVPAASACDKVRLADTAKGEVYIGFEGPLGTHLKSEAREKIWRGDYVEICSMLPLEKCNLDWVKPNESEEEEWRWYRLILCMFSNWLQTFAILYSIIGEKAQDNCSMLFVLPGFHWGSIQGLWG